MNVRLGTDCTACSKVVGAVMIDHANLNSVSEQTVKKAASV